MELEYSAIDLQRAKREQQPAWYDDYFCAAVRLEAVSVLRAKLTATPPTPLHEPRAWIWSLRPEGLVGVPCDPGPWRLSRNNRWLRPTQAFLVQGSCTENLYETPRGGSILSGCATRHYFTLCPALSTVLNRLKIALIYLGTSEAG